MSEPIEIDELELVLENFYNLLLVKANKLGREVRNLGRNLTL